MTTLNAKRMLHREPYPQSMEAMGNNCNTETGKRLRDTEAWKMRLDDTKEGKEEEAGRLREPMETFAI